MYVPPPGELTPLLWSPGAYSAMITKPMPWLGGQTLQGENGGEGGGGGRNDSLAIIHLSENMHDIILIWIKVKLMDVLIRFVN